jgi:uncharacterized protein YqeY
MNLEEKIRQDLNQALKEKDTLRLSTLRFCLAEIRNFGLQKQKELTDEDVVEVIRRQVKLRKEAVEVYQKGGRNDLAEKESKELEILSKYLPQQLSPQDLEKIIRETIAEIGAKSAEDFGKVMGVVMAKVKGQAEGAMVAAEVKRLLGQ